MANRLPRFLPGSGATVPPAPTPPLPPGAPLPVADMLLAWNAGHTQLQVGWNRSHNLAGALPDHFREIVKGHDGVTYLDFTGTAATFQPGQLGRTYGDIGFTGFPGPAYPFTLTIYAIANGFNAAGVSVQSPP